MASVSAICCYLAHDRRVCWTWKRNENHWFLFGPVYTLVLVLEDFKPTFKIPTGHISSQNAALSSPNTPGTLSEVLFMCRRNYTGVGIVLDPWKRRLRSQYGARDTVLRHWQWIFDSEKVEWVINLCLWNARIKSHCRYWQEWYFYTCLFMTWPYCYSLHGYTRSRGTSLVRLSDKTKRQDE